MIRCSEIANKYTITQIIRYSFWLLRTKFICRNAKMFGFPIDLRGRKYIDFGSNLSLGIGCRFDIFNNKRKCHTLSFGKDVQINDYVHFVAMDTVIIGNNVLMASHIFISDNSHGSYKGDENDSSPLTPPIKRDYPTSPIVIGDNTWICEGVVIMPGTNIGKGCIIGAHSIVRGKIPDYSIAVGNPAKVIKQYNFDLNRWERV